MNINKLDQLYGMRKRLQAIYDEYAKMENDIIPPEVQQAILEMREERATTTAPLIQNIINLENAIKNDTTTAKATLQGNHLMCVYNPGGKSVKAEDVEKMALRYEQSNPALAVELRSIISNKKPSASIQERQ